MFELHVSLIGWRMGFVKIQHHSVGANKVVFFVLFVLVILPCIYFYSCDIVDEGEVALLRELESYRGGSEVYLDLESIFGGRWDYMCVQTAYIPKKYFEKLVGRKVDNVVEMSEEYMAIWLFSKDGSHAFKVHRFKQGDHLFSKGPPCIGIRSGLFVICSNDGKTKYYFWSKEE